MDELNVKVTTGKIVKMYFAEDHEEVGRLGANVVADTIRGIDEPAISFAAGQTPQPVYGELAEMFNRGEISFAKVKAFLHDEYFDLPISHRNTFRYYLDNHLFNMVDIDKKNIHYFEGRIEDHMRTCFEFEEKIKAIGGIDLQILGIGVNGHIAFNEPGTSKDTRTRLIRLDESTRLANVRFFASLSEVPHYALSQGIANILESRKVMLMAVGANKDEAVYMALKEPVTPDVPASYLQEFEGEVIFIVDRLAGKKLL